MPVLFAAMGHVGYILIIIFAIVILIVLMLLFVPFIYTVDGNINESPTVRAKIRFLGKLFVFTYLYKDSDHSFRIQFLWIKKRFRKKKKEPEKKSSKEQEEETKKQSISDKIKGALDFIKQEQNRATVKYVLDKGLKLLKRIAPEHIKTDLDYSLGQPDHTGLVTGLISMVPVVYMYDIHAYPDFEADNMYILGKFHVQGKIRIIHILVFIIALIKNKQIRKLFKEYRRNKNGK